VDPVHRVLLLVGSALVEIIMCECDFGLGVPMPSHYHVRKQLIRSTVDDRQIWMTNFWTKGNPGWEVVIECEEIVFSVDWKALFRDAINA
jgi:hypothetical protein